ncbi:MAG: alkane 1-monooxygenase [Bacteroidota bacterium]
MKDLKYLLAYLIPITSVLAINLQGAWSYSTVIFAFGILPLFDQFLPSSKEKYSTEEKSSRLKNKLFDWLLYLNLPLLYAIVFYHLNTLATADLSNSEYTGLILSVGIVIGACGINVGHELGHRTNKKENWIAKLLLLPALYMHFFIEHNRGHHKHVATPKDPATARKNEILYVFWFRSVIGSYLNAWKLEKNRLQRANESFWSLKNDMLVFHLIQIAYLVIIALIWNVEIMLWAVVTGAVGFLLLETINYIEHYGLLRKKMESGKYERVRPIHSWNANYQLGRIMLYELTRHSDHHFLASKKYQILDHKEEAKQLPLGYPASMLMAMVPPLWFGVMNRRLEKME